ncbi:hypothetical protein Lal_00013491 [Lupinus albus]|nr:hypothetical protein Lal_00013491 [Lupinus albus]
MLNNAHISPNQVRVSIDITIEEDAFLPIPLDEDIITLGGAICTFVAWPVHLVDVVPTKGKVITEQVQHPLPKGNMHPKTPKW